jgi:uncharacterized protein YjbI with pentapeptide repeats
MNPVRTKDEIVSAKSNLSGANLYGANLSGANLYGADLSGANLYGADLSRADLSRADLSEANLSGADLSGADLYGADLCRADLSGANLSRADLSGANLSRADLSGAVWGYKSPVAIRLLLLGACQPALDWVEAEGTEGTIADMIAQCPDREWLAWLAGTLGTGSTVTAERFEAVTSYLLRNTRGVL